MSTNSNCLFVQVETESYYYILEDYNAPKNSWDWREFSSSYGPFASYEEANQHLVDNHANPGGSSAKMLPEGVTRLDLTQDSVLAQCIASAQAPERLGDGERW